MIAKAKPDEKPTTCPHCGADVIGVVLGPTESPACCLHPFDHAIEMNSVKVTTSYYPPVFLGTRAPIAKKNRRLTVWEKKHQDDWIITDTTDSDGQRVYRSRHKSSLDSQADVRLWARYEAVCTQLQAVGLTPKPFAEWLTYLRAHQAG